MHKYSSFFRGEVYEGGEPYAFVSYSHRDSNIVLPLVSDLYDKGLRVWFDEGIEAGSEWPDYLAEHLAKSSVVLAFVSQNFDESKYCRRELHYATRLNKPVICIYIDDAKFSYGLEMEIASIQGFKKSNFSSDELMIREILSVRIIESILDKTKEPVLTAEPVCPIVPDPVPVTEVTAVRPHAKQTPKTKKKSKKALWIVLIIAGAVQIAFILIIVGIIAGTSKLASANDKVTAERINQKKELLASSGVAYYGEITEEMLLGRYCQIDLKWNEKNSVYTATELLADYPDMQFVERMTNPKYGTASRSAATAVPLYIECKRLIDDYDIRLPSDFTAGRDALDRESGWKQLYECLYASDAGSADDKYDSYVELYNTFYVRMCFFTEDGTEAEGKYEYIYIIENNVMYCSRFSIGVDNTIILYDSIETYNIGFADNRLTIEAGGSKTELIPQKLYRYIRNILSAYNVSGYLYDPDNAYLDITGISISVSDENSGSFKESVTVYFADGGRTTDAEVKWNSWGNLTLSWYAVYHSDTGTTDAEPNCITISLIGDGPFFIIDEAGNIYNYGAESSDVYKDPATVVKNG